MGNGQSRYDGGSIEGMVECTNYSVVVGIKVNNNTNYPLHKGRATLEWGYLQSMLDHVDAKQSGIMISHKNPTTATGTSGVVSWEIGKTQKRLVVMWSAPFNFDFHENVLAVGFSGDHPNFDEMYNFLKCRRGESMDIAKCYYASPTLVARYDDLEVNGAMGTAHKAVASINLNMN